MAAAFTQARPRTAARLLQALAAVALCNAVGILGAVFTTPDTAWYTALAKPSFQPPGWLFGPVWTALYTMMGVAAFRIFERRDRRGATAALVLFGAQLVLNGIWSPVFFGAQAIRVSLVILFALVGMVALVLRRFRAIDEAAGWLLAPYLAWLSFASVLNGAIVWLN